MSSARLKPLPPIPTLRPEEVPEREQEYTKESLLQFKEETTARNDAERLAAAGGGDGGFFGGFGGGGGDEEDQKTEEGAVDDATITEVHALWDMYRLHNRACGV